MAKRQKPIRLAIFDIDGTIFRSSLIIELFHELMRRGIYPRHAWTEVEPVYRAWTDRKGHYNDYVMRLVKVFYTHLAGCSTRMIAPAVRAVIARQKDRVHRYPRQLMKDLSARGYFLLIISNSPEPIVQRFALAMHFDAAIGHRLEIADGIYTGRSIVDGVPRAGTWFMEKVSALQRFVTDHKMRVDLTRSVMIGDSEGDVPLLSHVGRPVAFNPSLALARIAKRRGWPIVLERKDAVYRIRDADFVRVIGQEPKVPYGNQR